ncbi:hypothetical protein AX15_004414 [Amanita polypyramis BW_CC]|nr:hypothetical protein AX15_004414 [Amanita polypyramis BW_CC]
MHPFTTPTRDPFTDSREDVMGKKKKKSTNVRMIFWWIMESGERSLRQDYNVDIVDLRNTGRRAEPLSTGSGVAFGGKERTSWASSAVNRGLIGFCRSITLKGMSRR